MFATEESVPKQRLAQFTASYGNLESKTERMKEKKKKKICKDGSWWRKYYRQASFTWPALLSICVTSRVLVKSNDKMGNMVHLPKLKEKG